MEPHISFLSPLHQMRMIAVSKSIKPQTFLIIFPLGGQQQIQSGNYLSFYQSFYWGQLWAQIDANSSQWFGPKITFFKTMLQSVRMTLLLHFEEPLVNKLIFAPNHFAAAQKIHFRRHFEVWKFKKAKYCWWNDWQSNSVS